MAQGDFGQYLVIQGPASALSAHGQPQISKIELEPGRVLWLNRAPLAGRSELVGYPSGQRGQTVNLLAYAFDSSNLSPTTIFFLSGLLPT